MVTSPVSPLNTTKSPSLISLVALFKPTTAAISKVLDIIAVWEVLPPISVKKPKTFFLSIVAVSDGVKSWATNTTSSSKSARSTTLTPNMCLIILLVTSFISAALSLIYSLSMLSNIVTNISFISFNANSALTFSSFILHTADSTNSGSSNTNKWASNISASCSPSSAKAFSLTFVSSSLEIATASFNFVTSSCVSFIVFLSITNSVSSITNAFPNTIPGDAPIPFNMLLILLKILLH